MDNSRITPTTLTSQDSLSFYQDSIFWEPAIPACNNDDQVTPARKRPCQQRKDSWLGFFLLLSWIVSFSSAVCAGIFLLHQLDQTSSTPAVEVVDSQPVEVAEPASPEAKKPGTQTSSNENKLRPIFPNDFRIPEHQLYYPNYPIVNDSLLGKTVYITGGWMERDGHSWKSPKLAIFSNSPNEIQSLPASNRNLGHDYVVDDYNVRNWYPGTVEKVSWEQGYGLRVHVKFNVLFEFQDEQYILWGAYAHNQSCLVEVGQSIEQGEEICIMGGSSSPQNLNAYPPHVDFRTWIYIDGQQVDVSPNLIEAQLRSR